MERRTNGAAVSAIREALGMRQGALAARLGISRPYMSQIESGVRQPDAPVARSIATELGVPLEAVTYPWSGGEDFGDDSEPAKAAS